MSGRQPGWALTVDPGLVWSTFLGGTNIDEANANGQKIKYVIETHSHADFVSGHIELAAKTGAEIIYGQRANTQFPTHKVKDGDEISIVPAIAGGAA